MTIKTFGIVEDEVMRQMNSAMEKSGAEYGVLCADNHLGYSVPVGGVIAFSNSICVNGVGYDIACGNKAIRLDCDAKTVHIKTDVLSRQISAGVRNPITNSIVK